MKFFLIDLNFDVWIKWNNWCQYTFKLFIFLRPMLNVWLLLLPSPFNDTNTLKEAPHVIHDYPLLLLSTWSNSGFYWKYTLLSPMNWEALTSMVTVKPCCCLSTHVSLAQFFCYMSPMLHAILYFGLSLVLHCKLGFPYCRLKVYGDIQSMGQELRTRHTRTCTMPYGRYCMWKGGQVSTRASSHR